MSKLKVIKRDGRVKDFEYKRIEDAINKAYLEVYGYECGIDLEDTITDEIMVLAEDNGAISVEEIQDVVVNALMKTDKKVGEAYDEYRRKRSIARNNKKYNDYLSIINAVSNDITKENANMNASSPAGMMMKFASENTKQFVDDKLISKDVEKAMKDWFIYPHDKDYYVTKSLTCLQHPLDRILENGFRAGHGSSRPAKRIETASMIGCISLETIQNEMHGGQAIPAWDFYLAPYVRLSYIEEIKKSEKLLGLNLSHLYDCGIDEYVNKPLDNLTDEPRIKQNAINNTVNRVHQSMESFIHNMNTIHSRGGNQVVFSSINYGTDTSPEGRCIIRETLLSTYEGVGNGETPIFPIQIWKKKRGVNYLPSDKNYDLYKLACKVTAKRFFPNFINLDASFNQSELWKPDDPKRYIHECATMGKMSAPSYSDM